MDEIPPRFVPLQPPPRSARVAVLIAGPLLWAVALAVVAIVIGQLEVVGVALLITAISFAVAVPLLLLARRRRLRDEGGARNAHAG